MYSHAFLRFWWVLMLGLAAAVAVGGLVAKRHRPPTYSTPSQLLVDSAQHPFLRVSVGSETSPSTSTSAKGVSSHPANNPDTQALVQAANFYPMLINSDVVKQYREKKFGGLPGTGKARAA